MTDRSRLSPRKSYEISKYLEFTALETFDGARSTYKPGWSDQKVADHFKVSWHNIRSLRSKVFGDIRLRKESSPEKKIAYLESLIEEIKRSMK